MNVAIILAGGSGQRMGIDIPKQFLKVKDKPIIVHTLEKFQKHLDIDVIEVVCLEPYIETVWEYAELYNLPKLKWVTAGGDSCQESIRNGVYNLEKRINAEDIVMLHMSVSPLIDESIINDSLLVCRKYGNAVSVDPCIFNMCSNNDGISSDKYILKCGYVTLNMPWTFMYSKLLWAYKKAYSEKIATDKDSYTPTMMIDLGEKIFFSKGSQINKLKITTMDDVDMFEGYLMLMEQRK
jgi:2-C-methyl-D-erythritol 4-phosphate cytidylyltransferase